MSARLLCRLTLASIPVLAGAVALLGCGQENSPPGAFAASTAAGSTAPATAPVGPFPRGQADPNTLPDPAKQGPTLTIVAPARGAQLTATTVDVVVDAQDPDGVASVEIAGGAAALRQGSEYGVLVSLPPGLDLIPVVARDTLGNHSTAYVSVTQGAFVPYDTMQSRTVAVGITQVGLDRIEDVAATATGTLDLGSLFASSNPVLQSTLLTVDVLGMQHAPPRYEIDGTPSGAQVTVLLDNCSVDIKADVIGVATVNATILAQNITGAITANVSQAGYTGSMPGKQALGLEISSIDITINGFQMVSSNALVSTLLSPFQGLLKNMLAGKLEDFLLDAVSKELSKTLPGVDAPLPLVFASPTLVGQPLAVDLMLEVNEAHGYSGAGLGLAAGFRATPAQVGVPGGPLDVLATGTTVTPTIGPEPFSLEFSEDAFNAVLHNLWQTGGIVVALDGTHAPRPGMPPLNVKLLYPFLPPIRGLAPDPLTPVVIEVGLGAPPVATFEPGAQPFMLGIGELSVTASIDYMDGGPRAELFTLRTGLELGMDLTYSQGELKISALAATQAELDIIAEPTVDLADQEIEDFFRGLVPKLLDAVKNSIPAVPLPALPYGMNLDNVRIEAQQDAIRLAGSL